MFKWTMDMRIDNDVIDEDHKKLISLANHILELNRPNQDAEALKQAIRELYDYVKYHFAREEVLMVKLKYAAAEEHHEKHAAIVKDMNHYLTSSHHMGEMLSNFRNLMNKWVMNHIMEEDMKFHYFMESKVDSFLKKD